MAVSKYSVFGTWDKDTDNTFTDQQLLDQSDAFKNGIPRGSTAYSNILNALMRQTTKMVKNFSDVIAAKGAVDITSTMADADLRNAILTSLKNITLESAVKIASVEPVNLFGPITYNSQGLVTNSRALRSDDIPQLSMGKITDLDAALSGKVSTTVTIAGNQLNANISRDNLLGVNSNGYYKRTGNNTFTVENKTFVETSRKVGSGTLSKDLTIDDITNLTTLGVLKRTGANTYVAESLTSSEIPNISITQVTGLEAALNDKPSSSNTVAGHMIKNNPTRDQVIGISTGIGLVKRTGNNSYALDTNTYALSSSVTVTAKKQSANLQIWTGTEAEYNAETKSNSVIYFIV